MVESYALLPPHYPSGPQIFLKKIFIYLFVCVPVCVFSGSVMSNSLRPQGLWPAKLLCPGDFYRQEYWSGLPFPPPGDLPDPWTEPMSLACPALASRFFTTGSPGNPLFGCLLSCDVGVLVPWPEIKPGHPASGAQSLSPWTTSEVPMPPDLDHDVYSHFRHTGWGLHYSPPNHFHEVFISRSPPLSHNCPITPAWQPLRDKTVTREERTDVFRTTTVKPYSWMETTETNLPVQTSIWMCDLQGRGNSTVIPGHQCHPSYLFYTPRWQTQVSLI